VIDPMLALSLVIAVGMLLAALRDRERPRRTLRRGTIDGREAWRRMRGVP
jgi:hypothetical protein